MPEGAQPGQTISIPMQACGTVVQGLQGIFSFYLDQVYRSQKQQPLLCIHTCNLYIHGVVDFGMNLVMDCMSCSSSLVYS